MQTTSALELSKLLQEKRQADQQVVDQLTQAQLSQHAQSLQKLLSDALATTEAAIQHQAEALNALHQASLRRLRWLMLWPVLASLCIALLLPIAAGAWSWWTVNQARQQVTDHEARLQQMTQQFCSSPAGLKQCANKNQR